MSVSNQEYGAQEPPLGRRFGRDFSRLKNGLRIHECLKILKRFFRFLTDVNYFQCSLSERMFS